MNKQLLLSLTIAASISTIRIPAIARSQTRIGDLQQYDPTE
ncbi:hypothetical protein [Gloeocapsopsis dulcis]|nr:hypothetical protein [Gloeocapsopsis dulcis]WNN90896.1 hypothetical protein P0S91_07430 [Gloeocapsopsis dulcis]